MSVVAVAGLYVLFAVIATGVNLATQWGVLAVYGGRWDLYAAMAAGTLTGLVTKYVLDKNWIFGYRSKHLGDDGAKFLIYAFFGGFTTIVFWTTELAFDALLAGEAAKYVGGALGLAVGYVIKYQLDKHFVFKEAI